MFSAMTLSPLETAEQVIEKLGGLNAVEALTAARYKSVSQWKTSGKFPARTFLVMTKALRDRGFKAPVALWGMVSENELVVCE